MLILAAIGKVLATPFLWFWFKATPRLKAIILGVLFLLLLIASVLGYIAYLRWKTNKLEAENANIQLQHGLEGVQRTMEEANRAEANFNAATGEAERIRNANFSNTSLSDAERARCRAYPASQGCPR